MTGPAAERVICVLRQSPDWDALARGKAHESASFDRLIGRPPGTTSRLIQHWDDTCSLRFFAVRSRMKAIAETALREMRPPITTIEIKAFREPFDERALYIFTDDDDWFAPMLAPTLLQSAAGHSDSAVWSSVRFDGTLTIRPNTGFCYTNNYAIHGRLLASNPGQARRALQHFEADELLRSLRAERALLDLPLSITVKHPCSTVTLEKALSESTPLRSLIETIAAEPASGGHDPFAGGLDWARTRAAAVQRLFADCCGVSA